MRSRPVHKTNIWRDKKDIATATLTAIVIRVIPCSLAKGRMKDIRSNAKPMALSAFEAKDFNIWLPEHCQVARECMEFNHYFSYYFTFSFKSLGVFSDVSLN